MRWWSSVTIAPPTRNTIASTRDPMMTTSTIHVGTASSAAEQLTAEFDERVAEEPLHEQREQQHDRGHGQPQDVGRRTGLAVRGHVDDDRFRGLGGPAHDITESGRARDISELCHSKSDVEADLEHVAVGDFVVLAFDAELAGVACFGPRADLEQLVPVDDLGADEPALQVGVDDARGLGCLGTGAERPRARLLVAGGEKRAPPEQVVRGSARPARARTRRRRTSPASPRGASGSIAAISASMSMGTETAPAISGVDIRLARRVLQTTSIGFAVSRNAGASIARSSALRSAR